MINLILLFILEVVLFLIAFLITDRDILSPSCTMCAMFIVSTIFAILNVDNWNINFSFEALLILTSGIGVFVVVEAFCIVLCGKRKTMQCANGTSFQTTEVRNWIVISLIIFNIVIALWYYREIRVIVGNTPSIGLLFSTYRNLGVSRLEGRASESVSGIINQFLKITKATGYIGAFIAISNAISGNKRKRKQNILLIFMCVTSLLPIVMIASRGGILMYLSNILIIFYILWHQKYGWNRNLSWKIIRLGILGIIIGMPLFYYSAFLVGRKHTYGIIEYVSTYIGGSIALFDQYVQNPIPRTGFGEESLINFNKILNIFGFGISSTSYNLESRNLGALRSNVYTFFRRPLHDFGLGGMYLFTILVAIFFCWMYYKKIKYKDRSFKVDCWVLIYGYLYYWILASSILQYSMSYISIGCLLTIIIIILLYSGITRIRLKFGRH